MTKHGLYIFMVVIKKKIKQNLIDDRRRRNMEATYIPVNFHFFLRALLLGRLLPSTPQKMRK